jgi:hypothetical protein
VTFRISRHSGIAAAPADAIDLLWEQLGPRRDGASFSRTGAAITARWNEDAQVWSARDEQAEVGRAAVLEIVSGVCEQSPDLKSDWFAVSFLA